MKLKIEINVDEITHPSFSKKKRENAFNAWLNFLKSKKRDAFLPIDSLKTSIADIIVWRLANDMLDTGSCLKTNLSNKDGTEPIKISVEDEL